MLNLIVIDLIPKNYENIDWGYYIKILNRKDISYHNKLWIIKTKIPSKIANSINDYTFQENMHEKNIKFIINKLEQGFYCKDFKKKDK